MKRLVLIITNYNFIHVDFLLMFTLFQPRHKKCISQCIYLLHSLTTQSHEDCWLCKIFKDILIGKVVISQMSIMHRRPCPAIPPQRAEQFRTNRSNSPHTVIQSVSSASESSGQQTESSSSSIFLGRSGVRDADFAGSSVRV